VKKISTVILGCAFLLCGCQTTEEARAKRQADLDRTFDQYKGKTIGQFLREQPKFSAVNSYDITTLRKAFTLSTPPRYVTTTLPAYGMVPSVSSGQVVVDCELIIHASYTGIGRTFENWTIQSISYSGYGC